jgi:hypothetical protein
MSEIDTNFVTSQDTEFERNTAARIAQQSRHCYEVRTLLEGRADLRGVHAMADVVGENVLWCA